MIEQKLLHKQNIAASSYYQGQAQEAAKDAFMGGSGRPTAAKTN